MRSYERVLMGIAELIEHIGKHKQQAASMYKQYKELKDEEEMLKQELMARLQEVGLKSAKGERFSASMTSRPDVVVQHEQSIINWLKESPNVEEDAYIGLKVTPFKALARQVLKETGEVIPGTDLVTIESISVKENK